jgi:flagellar biosynthesis chaperone FliJ
MKKATAIFLSILTVAHFSSANSLEDRVNQLEQKVKQLEERLNQLEGRPIIQNKQKESILLNENKPAVEYVLLEKKFHKSL